MPEKSLIEFSRESGIPYQQIYLKVWQGRLKARKVDGRWRITETEAERFCQERKARLGDAANNEGTNKNVRRED